MIFGTPSKNENLLNHFEIGAINPLMLRFCSNQSWYKHIYKKEREKMLHTHFRRNILRNSGTSLVNGGFRGFWNPLHQKIRFFFTCMRRKKMFWVFPHWVISILGLLAKKTVSLSELRTKWLDIVVVWIFLSNFHQKCYFLLFFKFS